MRYSVISKGLSISQLQSEVVRCGGRNLKVASASKQILCDLEPASIAVLSNVPGLAIKKLGSIKPQIYPPIYSTYNLTAQEPIYATSQLALSSALYQIRELTTPPTIGTGVTIIIMDSGIRKTHIGLVDKVILEENFTSSPTVSDIFSHGTGLAFVAAGGQHAIGQEAGLLPGASLMNLKVLGDEGEGLVEDCILAIEYAITLKKDAVNKGLHPLDPLNPNTINISWGTEDDGDPDNPLRLVIKEAAIPGPEGLAVVAAAGNNGPLPGTITLPASMKEVVAVGAVTFVPFRVWQYSSRGPALDGTIKPDITFFGVNIITAGSRDDEVFELKAGTSFSCPGIAAGGPALLLLLRNLGFLTDEEAFTNRSPEDVGTLIGSVSIKPEGVLMDKDNDYGWGIPYGEKVIAGVTIGIQPIIESITPLITLAMMGMLIVPLGGMFK